MIRLRRVRIGRDLEQLRSINDRDAEFNYVSRSLESYPSSTTALDQLRERNPNWSPDSQNRNGFSKTPTGQVEVERCVCDGVGFRRIGHREPYRPMGTIRQPRRCQLDDGTMRSTSVLAGHY